MGTMPMMIDAAIALLTKGEMNESEIFSDKFVTGALFLAGTGELETSL
jgi:hypothetical protein